MFRNSASEQLKARLSDFGIANDARFVNVFAGCAEVGGGRSIPNKVTAELAGLARVHTPEALAALVLVMNDPEEPGTARVSAANSLP